MKKKTKTTHRVSNVKRINGRILHKVVKGIECKHCVACDKWKSLSEFGKRGNTEKFWDGLECWCRECTCEANRRSWHKHKEKRLIYTKEYAKTHQEQRRDYVNARYKELRDEIVEAYGSKCIRCGFSDRRALCIDHVNGNGLKERKLKNGANFLRKIIRENFPDDYQLLCANCNLIKAIENREIPVSKIYR